MKGFTTDKQLGKRDGRRYYQQKGVEGIVSASINQGMSSRVKNDAAYANTRLNNAEFGAAGSTAGAITRTLSQKWRYILAPFAAGKMAKDVRALMMDDTTNPWGQRSLQGTDWQKVLADKVSQYSKNPMSDYLNLQVGAQFNGQSGLAYSVTCPFLQNGKFIGKGVDGVDMFIYGVKVNPSKFNDSLESYEAASSELIFGTADYKEIEGEVEISGNIAAIKDTVQASDKMVAALFVFLPYRSANNEHYYLQELCSFQMIAAEPAA